MSRFIFETINLVQIFELWTMKWSSGNFKSWELNFKVNFPNTDIYCIKSK